jgi:hypothetical protein
MSKTRLLAAVLPLSVTATLVAAGCGGSGNGSSSTTSANGNAGALSAEAQSAATGDIPDNQMFLVFHNRPSGYSIKYPEGWTQVGSGSDVRFKDKSNVVHIVVVRGAATTPQSASAELAALRRSSPSLTVVSAPKLVTIKGMTVIKSAYSTRSAPNPVTGKRVTLLVNRYQLSNNGKAATVDLGTPKGVDNVDAYRLMIQSFRWS